MDMNFEIVSSTSHRSGNGHFRIRHSALKLPLAAVQAWNCRGQTFVLITIKMCSSVNVTPKRHFYDNVRVFWTIGRVNQMRGSTWVRAWEPRKKRNHNISRMSGGAPTQPMAIIFGILWDWDVTDVINCLKFCIDWLRGFWIMTGQISGSPVGKWYGFYNTGKQRLR